VLLEAGVIKTSSAAYYSHGFVVPKATSGQWRLVVDYKNLNAISEKMQWPIANIREIIQRLGSQRATIFCTMDLTSGYYQFPIHDDCQTQTAFMAAGGIYEWTRVPMGPSSSGSYFSKIMQTEVFNGLVQTIVEIYLDDIIVAASTDSDCVNRLETVFKRLNEKNMTVHPDKSVFGKSEVEYVGHKVDSQGYHFSRSRLDSVLEFSKPKDTKHPQRLLGFTNYFRDRIQNSSDLVHPLNSLLTGSGRIKSVTINWTDELNICFNKLIQAVHECPKLYYLNNNEPIFLRTDASEYGIGAYLFQITAEGKEHPIAFLSKSLDKRMRAWDVPQREGFAIFYAFEKLERFLRDRQFTLQTDHANLTRLKVNYGSNKKVQRWLQTFQHYDYHLEYITGESNIAADGLSRLCSSKEPLDADSIFSGNEQPRISVNNVSFDSDGNKYKKFLQVHSDINGHYGIAETIRRLKLAGETWPRMQSEVNHFIKACPTCLKNRRRTELPSTFPFTNSSYKPGERVQMDFIMALDEDKYGVKHILSIIDTFFRWIQLYPLTDISGENAARCLIQWSGRFEVPSQVSHDRDSAFQSELAREVINLLGAENIISLSYSKQENAIVERSHLETMKHLRNLISGRSAKNSYSLYVPFVERILNSSRMVIQSISIDIQSSPTTPQHRISHYHNGSKK